MIKMVTIYGGPMNAEMMFREGIRSADGRIVTHITPYESGVIIDFKNGDSKSICGFNYVLDFIKEETIHAETEKSK